VIAAKSWEVSVEMSTEGDDTYDTHTARMNSIQTLLPDGRYRLAMMGGGFVQNNRGGKIGIISP
jgi:hypothetical protein